MVLESVFITGCSAGGIGSGIAIEFQKQGLHVFATARDVQKLAHLKELANVTLLPLDVTSQQSVEAAVEAVKKSEKGGGNLKYLVNNAGLGLTTPLIHFDAEPGSSAREVWEVNYWGLLRVTKAFSGLLIQEKGCIVNIGSGAGLVYWPWIGIYASSKAAVNLVSETMRLELGLLHVRVISIITGFVSSNFHVNRSYQLPPASPYSSYEEEIVATIKDLPANVMTAGEVGKQIAQEALQGKSGEIYLGTQAWAGKWVLPYLPTWLKDYLFLTRISRLLARRKAALFYTKTL